MTGFYGIGNFYSEPVLTDTMWHKIEIRRFNNALTMQFDGGKNIDIIVSSGLSFQNMVLGGYSQYYGCCYMKGYIDDFTITLLE